jgi:two-component system OmpR family response regulator
MTVDLERRAVEGAGGEVALTAGEFDLFACLVERANRVLSRDQLMDLTRGRSMVDPLDRAIDVSMSRLRRKLEDAGFPADGLKTVRGQGYVLALPVEDAP